MNNFQDVYNTQEDHLESQGILRYYFVSKGKKDIVKTVQYQYVKHFNGTPLFNLGFGDYNLETGVVSDEDVSSNDDQYRVFYTVLNTIPRLFDVYGYVILMVQGSDSRQEFIENCKTNCSRKCNEGDCKKAHRRINIYRNFVDKNFEHLDKEYIFWGGEDLDNQNFIEPYKKGKKYNSVLVMRKNP